MVKIAVAGGSGNIGQEIIDALIATQKHEILLLSRKVYCLLASQSRFLGSQVDRFSKDAPSEDVLNRVRWVKVDYNDPKQLAQVLQGVHTLLSFTILQEDPLSPVQKNLIDAAVQAGVKRFAPSEWGSSNLEHLSWYAYKGETRRYLEELNKDKKVLEYTLFQPGFMMNYLTRPHKSSKHLQQIDTPWDLYNRRFIVMDGSDDHIITLTTVQDLANVVARAIDFEGEWPVVGGIKGTDISMGQFARLAESVRGGTPFKIERLKKNDLLSGEWKTSWLPKVEHPSIPSGQLDMMSRVIVSGLVLGISAKDFVVSDEWNQLLPDYKFTQAEDFLAEAWQGKP
ncbi:NAD(P)-binding protein [Penicillium macrosclerotiorum]|uniref:NAD(P)-binding protein n=1 Tax=Penicillium macrosclerotiorum TaxID=303699 RepID=UPI0025493E8F|nr:NAD(P)-binding protein [Penicillium macrosclerotiorum]KAJ5689983.1 NAD(P)-binding protein [Penicillium macrosclerotiorum]